MKREHGSLLGLYTIGIALLFLAGFFLLIIFGAKNYRNAVAGQNGNMHSRAVLSYLSTTLKGYDSRDAVSLEDSEYGQTLVIADGDSGYAIKLFCHEGKLMENYAAADMKPDPRDAQEIGETDLFELELNGGVLTVNTDAGSILLRLRSEGGGAQ